jgi:hypothetical protein
VITLRVDAGGEAVRVSIVGTRVEIPAALTAAFFRISDIAVSDYRGVLAGRTIVEAEGGDVTLVDDGTIAGFAIRLNAMTAPD